MLCCIPLWYGLEEGGGGRYRFSKAVFILYEIAFAPAPKPYQIRLLFTHDNGDFGAISVTERSYAASRRSLKWRVTPSCPKALFQSETKCKAIVKKMIFYSHANKIEFHQKVFALSLVLKVRVYGTRKWHI